MATVKLRTWTPDAVPAGTPITCNGTLVGTVLTALPRNPVKVSECREFKAEVTDDDLVTQLQDSGPYPVPPFPSIGLLLKKE